LQNWVQFLIFALFLGAPALSWVVQQLREKSEVKRERAMAARRREEELRTGRTSESSQPQTLVAPKSDDRMTELQRLAERRQQQLRELRARQAQQQSTKASATIAPSAPAAGSGSGQQLPRGAGMRGGPLPNRQNTASQPPARRRPQSQPVQQQQPSRSSYGPRPASQSGDRVDIQTALRRAEAEATKAGQPGNQTISQQLAAAPVSDERGTTAKVRGAQPGIGREVRAMLRGSTRKNRTGPSLASLLAIGEVLGKPVSMRANEAEDRL